MEAVQAVKGEQAMTAVLETMRLKYNDYVKIDYLSYESSLSKILCYEYMRQHTYSKS